MKKYFVARLFAGLATTFAVTSLFAQDQNSAATDRMKPAQINAIAALVGEPLSEHAGTATFVKSKVMRSFMQLFADATDVKWSATDGQYYTTFKQNGKVCKAVFKSNGTMAFCLKYGTEKDLSREIRKQLKSTYLDYKIDMAVEVTTHDLNAWIINLSDSDNLVVASYHDDELKELHHYKKHF
jgi:hypothetical protein